MTGSRRVVVYSVLALAVVALVLGLAYVLVTGGESGGGVQTIDITTTG